MEDGRYDDECEKVLKDVAAVGVLLIVLGGFKGTGFSVATISPSLLSQLPKILRETADEIEKQK